VLRKPLTLVVQLPELAQLDVAQRRPTMEEKRHTLVTIVPRFAQLRVAERRKVPRKFIDHLHPCQRPHAAAPDGTLAGDLPSGPNLIMIRIGTSLPPPSAQWPGGQRGKRGSGSAMVAVRRRLEARGRACVVAVLVLVRRARFNHP
jgi:hypothetical protein